MIGFVLLTGEGYLKVTGNGAAALLQGQLTCDVNQTTPEKSTLGALCNREGRIISFFRLFKRNNDFYLKMPASNIPTTIAHLKKYAPFYKVDLVDDTASFTTIGLFKEGLNQLDWPEPTQVNSVIRYNDQLIIFLGGNPERYEVISLSAFSTNELTELPENQWHALSIAQGLPAVYPTTSGLFLPHELGLQHLQAISFDKGCYTGQEIIARMHYLGKLKTRLYRGRIESEVKIEPGMAVLAQTNITGNIVDCCQIDYNRYEILFTAREKDSLELLTLESDPGVSIQQLPV